MSIVLCCLFPEYSTVRYSTKSGMVVLKLQYSSAHIRQRQCGEHVFFSPFSHFFHCMQLWKLVKYNNGLGLYRSALEYYSESVLVFIVTPIIKYSTIILVTKLCTVFTTIIHLFCICIRRFSWHSLHAAFDISEVQSTFLDYTVSKRFDLVLWVPCHNSVN